MRTAPVQISFLGYCDTTGADFVDYMITDPVVVPPDVQRHHTERQIRLPHSYFVTSYPLTAAAVDWGPSPPVTRDELGLPNDAFVFCCFNHLYKIDPWTFSTWMAVLRRTPKSILWLLRTKSKAGDGSKAEPQLKAEAAAEGIDPRRIVFTDMLPEDIHLQVRDIRLMPWLHRREAPKLDLQAVVS